MNKLNKFLFKLNHSKTDLQKALTGGFSTVKTEWSLTPCRPYSIPNHSKNIPIIRGCLQNFTYDLPTILFTLKQDKLKLLERLNKGSDEYDIKKLDIKYNQDMLDCIEDFMLTNFVCSGTDYKSYLAENPE